MQFIVKAYDGPDMLEKRMEVRPRHLEGMKKQFKWGRVLSLRMQAYEKHE